MIDRRLAAGIRWSFLGLAFFLPLLVSTRSSEVFELPKMLFVYAMTAVIVGLWLGRMLARREILIRRTPLDIPILLFSISQIASTIYSIDPLVSWWGWYGRFHGGLVSTISYTLLYYALVSNFRMDSNEESPWRTPRRLLFTITASAIIVSGYAVLQHFGVDRDFWVQDVMNRVFSTQGQPNWLAGYLVMAIPLVFVITISEIINHKSYMISYFLFMIFFLALLWTKSRSGLIGLAVADLVFWSLIFFQFYLLKKRSYIDQQRSFKKEPTFPAVKKLYRLSTIVNNLYNFNKPNKAVSPVAVFFFIHSILIILILATNNPAREWILGRLQVTGYRLQATTIPAMESGITLRKSAHGGTESGDIRRIVWSGAIQLVKQRPIFGFGPETFGETYWWIRPKEHNLTSEWNFLYNKAHNEWLNLAANTGGFGLGSHLLIILWFSVWSFNQLKIRNPKSEIRNNDQNPKFKNSKLNSHGFDKLNFEFVSNFEIGASDLTIAAILAAIVGVEAVNFFGFSTVTIGTYRYLFMAAAVSAAGNTNKLLKTLPDRQGSSVINIVSKLLKPIADRVVTSVIQDRDRRDRDENLRKNMDLRQKFILAGLSALILYLISQVSIFFLADLAYNRGRAYQDGGYIEEAVEPLMQAVNLVPGEPVFRAELGEAEGSLAALLPARLTDNSEQRTENSEIILELKNDSIANFEIVRKQSPQNLGFIRTEARVLFSLGEEEQALQLMKLAMGMAPTNPQLPYSLGVMLSKMGQTEEAAVYYNKAVELKPDYSVSPPAINPVTLTPSSLR